MPSDHELAILADEFDKLWTPGENIRTWLRKQSVLMLKLLHGNWSWAALAIVFTRAGITYRTGKAWTTDSLRKEATRATQWHQLRDRHLKRHRTEKRPLTSMPS